MEKPIKPVEPCACETPAIKIDDSYCFRCHRPTPKYFERRNRFSVIDDPEKIGRGLLPEPLHKINEALGLQKWWHREPLKIV